MKSIVAFAGFVFALSLCNLTGRQSNRNSNSNSAPPGNMTENTNADVPAPPPPPPASGQSSQIRNSNTGIPGTSRIGVPTSTPINQAAKPTPPRAPISGGVLNGKAIRLVQPAYPAIAKAAHASGQVRVQVLIDENGNVISATPISGHPLLQPSAAAAARQSKFSPTLLSGQPVKVSGVLIYNFVLQ
jgi:protein TonB